MPKLNFSLVSPERELFSGEADAVRVPGTEGAFEVGAGHAPLMATLSPGILVIRNGGSEDKLFVRGGFAEVSASGLTVLAEAAIPENELKGEVLGDEKDRAQRRLAEPATPEDEIDARRAQDALAAY